MSALQTPQRTSRRKELRETSIVTLYAKAVLFFEENRTLVYGLLVGVLLLAAAIPGYLFYQQQQQEAANTELGQILPVYEQGRFQEALNGTGDREGLVTIADEYGSTPAGNLATFYAANAYYQMEEYDRALELYQAYEKGEDLFGASAYGALGALYENRGDYQQAAEHYEQAAAQYASDFDTPRYLFQAGRAYEAAEAYDAAISAYRRVINEYPDAQQASLAEQYLARAQARNRAS